MTNNTDAVAYAFLFSGDHEQIIYGALSRLHLSPVHADFDDYVQECRLAFPAIYRAFPEDPQTKPHQFLAYAQLALYRRILDQLRKAWRHQDHQETGDPELTLAAVPVAERLEDLVHARQYRLRLLQVVGTTGTLGEWRYLVGTLIDHRSAAELAAHHGVSRQTVYRWRRALLRRVAQEFFDQF
ncbi:RNA polymerase sigma factor [Levilactobacillus namurensis]|uniref:Helix-turn-helix domain-containing protein n=1 Tax=Levilactobacillus namurensis TaxID=380393 RepID=A0AAW8W4I6_9LACO|nr:helix-turn-helix domain-containing protein [Levilactobacillus namurensis]MDT7013653.1 helix-turn-helix domain-containing protein [Levilactobacillus namurensis]